MTGIDVRGEMMYSCYGGDYLWHCLAINRECERGIFVNKCEMGVLTFEVTINRFS